MITEDQIDFKMVKNMSTKTGGHMLYRDDKNGLQYEIHTPKSGERWGKSKHFFFIDKDPREFLTIEELIEAYNELYPKDDCSPHSNVYYLRVIREANQKAT